MLIYKIMISGITLVHYMISHIEEGRVTLTFETYMCACGCMGACKLGYTVIEHQESASAVPKQIVIDKKV